MKQVFSDKTIQSMTEKRLRKCIHFNGTINHACKARIAYDDVRDFPSQLADQPPFFQSVIPCLSEENCRTVCAQKQLPTAEAVAAEIESLANGLRQRSEDLKNDICPNCKIKIQKIQIGRCIYGAPCGCRLGQGKLKSVKAA